MKRGNRHERKRHYKLLRTPLERFGHSGKVGKQISHRTERRAIAQQCHMAKTDPEKEIFLDDPYNRRDWGHYRFGTWHWYGTKPEHKTWKHHQKRDKLQPKTRDEVRNMPQWMQHAYHKNVAAQSKEEEYYDRHVYDNYHRQWRQSLDHHAYAQDWETFNSVYNSYAYGDPPPFKARGEKANTRSEAHEIALKHGTPRWFKMHSQGVSEITFGEAETTSYFYLPRYTVYKANIFVQFKTYEQVRLERY